MNPDTQEVQNYAQFFNLPPISFLVQFAIVSALKYGRRRSINSEKHPPSGGGVVTKSFRGQLLSFFSMHRTLYMLSLFVKGGSYNGAYRSRKVRSHRRGTSPGRHKSRTAWSQCLCGFCIHTQCTGSRFL